MIYTKIKSNFIKAEIKKTKWKDRDYIDDLTTIEGFAFGRTFGLCTGYLRNRLVETYPKQWKAIWLELNPKTYKKNVERKRKEAEKEKKEEIHYLKKEVLELKNEKETWRDLGGLV